ncbi:helix-turn-helix transcriptional regulator [Virgibacillus pantothenticus]|uniref:helix-turn-helix domain-containing protein n=1 Tax=Virgibacillus pantothenticus TaxID=1473 RepID=UPI001C23EBFA|nr:helix-turn-helix transcriptional regulator [Virgibacillus pantothenticus]MBU8567724.1 helix-turn-helix transcriptional regulator [Virgibacillus pantothenticus]MBU8601519.1 helix-turn-helix transcriptional regulator [Virgibacillus pantothenticus]MBU8635748.1 helix-turn-helix transcriptional regulator [Virgibacillus pantothenticus]MBU8643452.1 helix-turn-helix transcriptional regulator [Virgibacillus pantothenticus]MBU8647678.1 helix-turn-helix transcriptional regulator [Virgibacillus pantoth
MIDIGYIIKLQRTKCNMTQEELSKGIVSLSYLSKIENQKTNANPEIIQSLCNRLGIELTDTPDAQIEEKCRKWYGMLYDRFDKREITEKYEELQKIMDGNINCQTIMFEIHKIRYYVVLRNFKKALHKINELHNMSDSFNPTHKYYWNKFKGNYYSFQENHQQSLHCYKKAEKASRLADIGEEEIADLHYGISIEYSKLLNGLETINYAKQAMTVFQSEYNFVRCAQCHILLGIAYQRIKMNDDALKNFKQAMRLGKLNQEEQIIQLVHLNLGRFYANMGDFKKSIENYLLTLNTTDLNYKPKLEAIISLIQNFHQNNEYSKAKEYLMLAEDTLSLSVENEYYKFYNYATLVYTHLLNGELKDFVSILVKEFIPYLRQRKDYQHIVFYSKLLASYLEDMGKHKASTQYYKLAVSSYDQLIRL